MDLTGLRGGKAMLRYGISVREILKRTVIVQAENIKLESGSVLQYNSIKNIQQKDTKIIP